MNASRDVRMSPERTAETHALASWVGGFGLLLAIVGAIVVLQAAGRGFDGTDEGLYLALAGRHRSYPTAAPGAFHLWGVVFTLAAHRVAVLRAAKLLIVLAVNVGLGFSLSRETQNAGTIGSFRDGDRRWWLLPSSAAVMALMTYSWTPQSPGYNEASALCWLGATAAIARLPARTRGAGPRSGLAPAMLGLSVTLALIAKWSGGVLLLVVAVAATMLMPSERGQLRWRACAVAAGAVVSASLCQLLVLDLPSFVRGTVNTSRLLAEGSHAPGALFSHYRETAADTVHLLRTRFQIPLVEFVLLAAASSIFATSRARTSRFVSATAAAAAIILLGRAFVEEFWRRGGPDELTTIMVMGPFVLLLAGAILVASAATALTSRPRAPEGPRVEAGARRRRVVLVGVLAIAPLGAAFGTDNPILALAPFAMTAWGSLLLMAVIGAAPISRRIGQIGMVMVSVVLAVMVSTVVASLRQHPYRIATSIDGQTATVNIGPLRGLRLDPASKRHWEQVSKAIHDASPGQRPRVIGLWRSPGAIFVSDALAVGVPWYSPPDPQLTAALIEADCRRDPGRVVVLRTADDTLDPRIEQAISRCGTPFPAGFEVAVEIAATTVSPTITVLAPTRSS